MSSEVTEEKKVQSVSSAKSKEVSPSEVSVDTASQKMLAKAEPEPEMLAVARMTMMSLTRISKK